MDIGSSFSRINRYISDGRTGLVRPEIDAIVSASGDPFTLIKCASLLKVIDDESGVQEILDMVAGNVPEEGRFDIAVALLGLNRPEDALDILEGMEDDDRVLRERTKAYLAAGDHISALETIGGMAVDSVRDRILLTEVLAAGGRLDEAYETARLLSEEDGSYGPMVNLCSVMIRMGRNKEAVRTARSRIKEGRNDADSLALGAYVMWINGRTSAAAGLAHSALKADHTHIGALETMAMCLIEKRRFTEAKLMAGAVNDKDPGNPAAIRILDACRIASR